MAIQNKLRILNEDQIKEIFNIPKIDPSDRDFIFEITPEDQVYLENEKLHNKIDYLLQVGYFRASRKFHKFSFNEIQDDVQYILSKYYPDKTLTTVSVSKDKHYAAQKYILKYFQWS